MSGIFVLEISVLSILEQHGYGWSIYHMMSSRSYVERLLLSLKAWVLYKVSLALFIKTVGNFSPLIQSLSGIFSKSITASVASLGVASRSFHPTRPEISCLHRVAIW